MARGQSERLVPMIEAVMAAAGADYEILDAIAVTRGPGGFTGVRIGLATARGLGLALSRPVLGLSSFEVAAAGVDAVPPGALLAAVIEAKRAEVYVQAFRALDGGTPPRPEAPGQALLPEALDRALPPGPLWLAGDGAARALPALKAAGREVEIAAAEACVAVSAANLAAALAASTGLPAAGAPPPRPIYLRGPDVTLPDGRKVQAPGTR